ncbi:MAG TPA: IclR family transcriptional regulator [Syntrophomonas sp.]|nr:IclR family transcriptional regulator [Syntrophomonas sp.]
MARKKQDGTKDLSGANQSSEKLLIIMEYLAVQAEPVRLLDIAKGTGMNTSTASRFLAALETRGYIAQDKSSGRYYLTYKICCLANKVSSRIDIRQISLPYLKALSQTLSCTSNLVVEYDLSVMYLDVVTGPQQMLVPLRYIGSVAPMHCTGAGKLLLTQFTDERLIELVELRGLKSYTENTITTLNGLKTELASISEHGYAFDNEECEIGTRCVAAPIRDYTNKIVAVLSINGTTAKLTDEYIDENLHYLLDTAGQISAQLGYESV